MDSIAENKDSGTMLSQLCGVICSKLHKVTERKHVRRRRITHAANVFVVCVNEGMENVPSLKTIK